MLFKKEVPKNFAKLEGIHLCPSIFLKKLHVTRLPFYKFAKLFRTDFFVEHLRQLLLCIDSMLLKPCVGYFFVCLFFQLKSSLRSRDILIFVFLSSPLFSLTVTALEDDRR